VKHVKARLIYLAALASVLGLPLFSLKSALGPWVGMSDGGGW